MSLKNKYRKRIYTTLTIGPVIQITGIPVLIFSH